MTRQMQVSVFLLLLLLLFAQLYSTSGILAEHSTGVVRELPRKGKGASQAYTVSTSERKFIRIVPSYEDLTEGNYCSQEGDVVKDFKGEDVHCEDYDVVSEDMKAALKSTIIPAAIKLHTDRLLIDPVSDPLKVPKFDEKSVCNNFTVPPEHRSVDIKDADMVLYVAARPVDPFGVICAKNKDDRPIVGAINLFIPSYRSHRYNVRRAAHEIAHALGFDYNVFREKDMVVESQFKDGKKRMLVKSDKTKEMVQKHYSCSTAEGMELEYDKREKKASSHWAYRVAKDDLMSSISNPGGGMYYSALTMAVFDDLPYYSANWAMVEPMTWGNNSDCYLLDYNYNDEFPKKYPSMFCIKGAPLSCTSDRTGVGNCDPTTYYTDYNNNPIYALYIKYVEGTSSDSVTTICSVKPSFDVPGSVFANDSLCLDTDEYKMKIKQQDVSSKGVCARIRCENDVVEVQYAGDDKWYECHEEESLQVKRSDSDTPITLKCPKYSEVCTVAPNGTSLPPPTVPPEDDPDTPPGSEGDSSIGGSDSTGGDGPGDDGQSGDDNSGSGNQGGDDNSGSGNQGGGNNSGSGDDGCIVPALLVPALLLVMSLALFLH